MKTSLGCLLLINLLISTAVHSQDVAIIIHPGTGLPSQMDKSHGDKRNEQALTRVLENYSRTEPVLLVGRSAKDAPAAARLVLELEDPKFSIYTDVFVGRSSDGLREVRFPYKGVFVVQPFSVWCRPKAGSAPALLGRSFAWAERAQVRMLRPVADNTTEHEYANLSVDEMVHLAVKDTLKDIAGLLADSWSSFIINASPVPHATPEGTLQVLQQSHRKAPVTLEMKTTYRPSRVVKDASGRVTVEIDLLNRLPFRAHGRLTCSAPPAPPLPWPPRPADFRVHNAALAARHKEQSCQFDLAPGQKAVARFIFPAGEVTSPEQLRNDDVAINGQSTLELADKPAPKPKKPMRTSNKH